MSDIDKNLININLKKQFFCILAYILIVGFIPITALSQSPDGELYIVQSGDSLSKLADKYYNDPSAYVSTTLPIDNLLTQSQTLYELLTELNFPSETLPSDILNHQVAEKAEDGHIYAGYKLLENDCALLLAYYYPFKETPSRLYLLQFDKNSQAWSYQSVEHLLIAGTNQIQSIEATRNFYFIYLHINPSAGLTIIVPHDMKTYHILKGYIYAAYDDDLIIYGPNQIHFASTHPSEIGIYNPFTQEAKIILPQTPDPPLWSARVDKMREVYELLIADNWCARNNHNCDPELFTRYFRNVTVNSDTDSLAFVADFIVTGPYDGPPYELNGQIIQAESQNVPYELSNGKIIHIEGQRVLYIFRGIHSGKPLEYREFDMRHLEQKRGENFNLADLLEKETLDRLFEEE